MYTSVILVNPIAADLMVRESLRSSDGNEAGGILLGYESEKNHPLTITVAGQPGPNAIRSRSRFLRDLAFAETLAGDAYERDRSVWVGEWHTHPKGPRQPSRRDLKTYRQFLADNELEFTEFASIVVTSLDSWKTVELNGWIIKIAKGFDEVNQLILASVQVVVETENEGAL